MKRSSLHHGRGWGDGGSSPPTPDECLRILAAYRVPAHIVGHSRVVARLTRRLTLEAAALLPSPPDPERMEAAALLHDIAKRPGAGRLEDHAAEGGRILRALGMPSLAPLVEKHINPGPAGDSGLLREEEVLAYCDKRVKHQEIVNLEERMEDLRSRYGAVDTEIALRIDMTGAVMRRIEARIFAELPYPPEAMLSW